MNKYQDAINEIKNNNDYDPTYNFDYDSYDVLQELIDKEEKYRWHDLTKDPTDLPKTFDTCILVTPDNEYVITRYFVDEDVWEYDYSSGSDNLAWRYMEDFKHE